jgi:adenylosuccinate synthase
MKAVELRIVLLSGPIGSGKTALAKQLVERYGASIVKTRELIAKLRPDLTSARSALQRAGEALDRRDNGAWLAAALAEFVEEQPRTEASPRIYVIDSVRILGQIEGIRKAFGSAVHHIHLTAAVDELARRFSSRKSEFSEPTEYAELRRSKTERKVEELAKVADVVVETDRCTAGAVCVRATALLGLYSRSVVGLVDVLVGGQYGSEGKGNIVAHIAPEYQLLVRVGGPNAGHKVFNDPVEVYHHIPSGTNRSPNARLLLGAGAVINVPKLLSEISVHKIDTDRLFIDGQAMIIEETDIETEKRLLAGISSTMQGVGAATARKALNRVPDDSLPEGIPKTRLAKDVPELRPFICEAQEILEGAYLHEHRILLEGTQGTTLSLHHGPYPFVTSRETTVAGCLADSGIAAKRVRKVVMVCRTFPIRVGGPSGHIEHEITYEELAKRSGIPIEKLKATETTTTTKKQRRLGEFDWEQLHRSSLLNGPTDIALTFVDYINVANQKAYRFEQLTSPTLLFIEEVERVSGVPVSLISTDFGWRNIIDRRAW